MQKIITILLAILLSGCKYNLWNDPNALIDANKKIYYASFNAPPKTLDPARSYSSDEVIFTAQIYEPPLQYNYLKRPYELEPLTATNLPEIIYLDKNHQPLPKSAPSSKIAYVVYRITIKPNIFYQPHPAFAKNKNGQFIYHHLTKNQTAKKSTLNDFKETGTRELTAEDYVYEIKRLADPNIQSPIFGVLASYIAGFDEFSKQLEQAHKKDGFLNLNQFPFEGASIVSRYQYEIVLKAPYQQFIYWLAMPFFSPVPWEVDYFYSQPGMDTQNITFDWYPVGTGPYMLTINNPNYLMVMSKNPNFHDEFYPSRGSSLDIKQGLLKYAGLKLPLVDTFVFSLEKESIPRWSKFLQGYYDQSAISSDNFNQVIQISDVGQTSLSPAMKAKKINLQTSVSSSLFYIGFNMLDPVIGGYTDKAIKLRQAITIAINMEEFISIFLNERGIPAQGPIPPGIFGYQEETNSYIYNDKNGRIQRKSLTYAKKLLAEAGYPDGRNQKTGEQLLLRLNVPSANDPEAQAEYSWYREQFAKLGIALEINATDYNRFQDLVRAGNTQLFLWGWNADYPDPENFLFLLYGANGKVKFGGENASNYNNNAYNQLFDQMKNMPNGPQRSLIIKKMLAISECDNPWIWCFFPKDYILSQQCISPSKTISV
ncbi:MAG: ABC transporter substrate-binding protein, partial [Gammaproteobacteria bacterium]